jgi:hypothetical protein
MAAPYQIKTRTAAFAAVRVSGQSYLADFLPRRPYFYPSFLRQQESMRPLVNLKGWIPACAGMTGMGKGMASCC